MMHLLRSTFVAAASDNKDLLLRNYLALVDSGLDFDIKEDKTVWEYVRDFVRSYGEVPGINTLKGHFSTIKEDTIVDRLEQLAMAPSLGIGDFLVRLEDKANLRRIVQTQDILTQAGHILSQGKEVTRGKEKIKLKGPLDAIRYVMDQGHDVTAPTIGSHLSGEITGDGADFMARYERVESDPLAGIGQHSGLFQLDTAINGAKKFELWIHAAYTGGLKSTWALNWAYNQAVFFLQDNLMFSMEMPYEQCRNILYSMHSMHPKFKAIRYQLGLQSTPDAVACIPYEFIRDGTLSKYHSNAKQFLKEYVVPDFNGERVIDGIDPQTKQPWVDPKNYGKIFIEVADPDKPDFTMADLRHRAEVIFSKTPFGMIFIDHVGLMAPRKWVSSTTDRLNEIIRDCKRLAMSFNRGRGMAVIALFQISRDGYRTALKRKEKTGIAEYDLCSLSYSNEAERCVITGTYVNASQGMIPIKEIKIGDQVWSSSGWKTVSQVFDNGVRRVWNVQTDRGSILEGTEKHRVRVLTDGDFAWKTIKDLSISDYVIGTFGDIPWPEKSPELPPLVIGWHEKANGEQGRPIVVPKCVTPELAYLLGSWDGDGAVKPDGLGWTGNRLELAVRNKIMSLFERVFDHPLGLTQSPSRPGSFDLRKCSAPLMRWFEGIAGERFLEVPDVILQSPRAVVLAYVHGLFDTDGWVNNQGIVGIKMKAACIPFLRQVQMLLTKLNIDSCLCFGEDYLEVTGKTYYNAQLRLRSRIGRERFLAEIGFTEPAKQAWLETFVNRVHDSCKKKDGQVYPVLQTFIAAQKQTHSKNYTWAGAPRVVQRVPDQIRRSGRVPRGAIETLTQYTSDKGITSPEISFLRRLLDLQIMQVVSVEDTGRDEPVMDLEVDGDHEYQTGPILSHNSGDIVTATFIDDDLRKMNRVQFQCLKSRDQKPFERFEARVEWACRRMLTCMDVSMKPTTMAAGTANKEAIEKAGKLLD